MDRKTKESCKYDTLSLKRINVSCHKRTIISESERRCPGQKEMEKKYYKEEIQPDRKTDY